MAIASMPRPHRPGLGMLQLNRKSLPRPTTRTIRSPGEENYLRGVRATVTILRSPHDPALQENTNNGSDPNGTTPFESNNLRRRAILSWARSLPIQTKAISFFFDAAFVCCGAGPSPSDPGNEWLLAGDEAKLIFLWAASLAYHGTR